MTSESSQKVVFSLGAEEYAIDIQRVAEIRGYGAVTHMASAPGYIKGIVNLRGLIVLIVDLRIKLAIGTPTYDDSTVVILTSIGGATVGLVVDGVSDVTTLDPDQIKPFPETGGAAGGATFQTGVATVDDRLLILIDVDKLLPELAPISQLTE